ncbi:MAG: PaaI family thioesterase [Pseudomonadota bacterium]|nr:PaaI family thioesterase [Pseudomonadota bacterium]
MSDTEVDTVDLINSRRAGFSKLLGLVVTEATPDCVKATLKVREELCTRPEVLHGGAIMAFADNLGALACVLNLPEGARTTTLESKTNFLSSIPVGQTAHAETTALHKGRSTMVWRTDIKREDGKLCAVVTQTQMVLMPK